MLTTKSSESGLSTKTDNQLVNDIKEKKHEDNALTELINRHSGIFINALQKFSYSVDGSRNNFYDMIEEKATFFLDTANKFDESKGMKFSSFLHNMVFYKCGRERCRATRNKETASGDVFSMFPPASTHRDYSERDFLERRAIEEIDNIKNKKIRDVLRTKYVTGNGKVTFRELSEKNGYTIEWCRKLHDKGIEILKKRMTSC